MLSFPERVAQCALDKFRALPPKCKPRVGLDGKREWTIMSAIVVCKGLEQQELSCVSIGTGTKCLSSKILPNCHGSVLHDCHAEILALRGFNCWILSEIRHILTDELYRSQYIVRNCSAAAGTEAGSNPVSRPFIFAADVSIHLFTTEAPCGDASMELLISSKIPEDAVPWSKAAEEANGPPMLLGRGYFSVLGAVRRKPARADAEQSLSKSCTDKLAVKQFTGLLSFPADLFLQRSTNAYLGSLVLYHDHFHSVGYQRAFGREGRLSSVLAHDAHFFQIQTLPAGFEKFPFEKTLIPPNSHSPKQKASNISMVWIQGPPSQPKNDVIEVLISGVKQGFKLFDERERKESILCRKRMWLLGRDVYDLLHQNANFPTFSNSSVRSSDRDDVATALQSRTYSEAKGNAARQEQVRLRHNVVAQMGSWIKNIGDDEWSLG